MMTQDVERQSSPSTPDRHRTLHRGSSFYGVESEYGGSRTQDKNDKNIVIPPAIEELDVFSADQLVEESDIRAKAIEAMNNR